MKPCPERNIKLIFKESRTAFCDLKKKKIPKSQLPARAARMLCADKTRQMACMIS